MGGSDGDGKSKSRPRQARSISKSSVRAEQPPGEGLRKPARDEPTDDSKEVSSNRPPIDLGLQRDAILDAWKTEERIACGDTTPLLSPLPPMAGTFNDSAQGACVDHILNQSLADDDNDQQPQDNRFNWFEKASEGAFPNGPIVRTFECEFHEALATIVGSTIDPADNDVTGQGYRIVGWDGQLGEPGRIPAVTFGVEGAADSTPELRRLDVSLDRPSIPSSQTSQLVSVTVLVNDGPPFAEGERTERDVRPPLWIHFDTPQRAVGLEFGYLAGDEEQAEPLATRSVFLEAFDYVGQPLEGVESDGAAIQALDTSVLKRDLVRYRIGVQHSNAQIRSVRLSFGRSAAGTGEVLAPQVIYRVWHEPFPAAAVYQGTISALGSGASTTEVTLPYHCDRAVVLMRGFHAAFGGNNGRQVKRLTARLTGTTDFIGEPQDSFSFGIEGEMVEGNNVSKDVSVYYTVVTWNSREMSLLTTNLDSGIHPSFTLPNIPEISMYPVSDPCVLPENTTRTDNLCGPIVGALQGFKFLSNENRHVPNLELAINPPVLEGPDHPERQAVGVFPATFFNAGLEWRQVVRMDKPEHFLPRFTATAVTGRSLKIGRFMPGGGVAPQTSEFFKRRRRALEEPFIRTDGENADEAYTWLVHAEMAFVTLSHAILEPEGDVKELDVEVKGTRYDGNTLDWFAHGGVGTGNDDDRRWFSATATFGGLVRRSVFGAPRMAVRHIDIQNAVVGSSSGTAPAGFIWNNGDLPLRIVDLQLQGANADEFDILILGTRDLFRGFRGQAFDGLTNFLPSMGGGTLDEVKKLLPLVLPPEFRLNVYAYARPSSSDPTIRRAVLRAETNSILGTYKYLHLGLEAEVTV